MTSCDSCGERPNKNDKNEKEFKDLCPFNRMADGRAFTDYRPKCQKLTKMSSYDERMYLTNNAKNIIDTLNTQFICSTCTLKSNDVKSTMLPEKMRQICNKNICTFELNDPNGIGLGR
jgi:hypothetical protein